LIRKAVIAAGGLGTRLLPATKEQPKEMLPVLCPMETGEYSTKPFLQLIFENLYDFGIREFCLIVGKGKRTIEDHFTPDREYVRLLKSRRRPAWELENFFSKIEDSNITWVNQPRPLGLGDAILRAKSVFGDDEFLMQAGDTYILSSGNAHLKRLTEIFYTQDASAVLTILQNCFGPYDSVIAKDGTGNIEVQEIVEEGCVSKGGIGVIPVHIINPRIFEKTDFPRASSKEITLAGLFQICIERGAKILGVPLESNELCLDIGTPERYFSTICKLRTHGLTDG